MMHSVLKRGPVEAGVLRWWELKAMRFGVLYTASRASLC